MCQRVITNLRVMNVCIDTATKLERVMGIEPTSSAWKAEVLPLNYTRQELVAAAGN